MYGNQLTIYGIDYEVCGQIGEGGTSHVFVVRDKQNKKYALKMINQYGHNPILKEMVDREIKIQSLFNSDPHIIHIMAHKVHMKKMFVILELGQCSLRNKISMQAHIELGEFLKITRDSCKGLMSIHARDMIHRDIKPENIICIQGLYKITDLGSLQQGQTADGRIGTPLYLPPQILQQSCMYDQRLDIWSLGVTLFETYFKMHPFYYSKGIKEMKQVYKQMKDNISMLVPNFTVQKLLNHLNKRNICKQEQQSIKNKLLITPTTILNQFQQFFRQLKERPQIQYFVDVFTSLQEDWRSKQIKQCKLSQSLVLIPADIQLYVITLNTIYQLSSTYGYKEMNEVQCCLEGAIRYWSCKNHQDKQFISYTSQAISKGQLDLWQFIKKSIFTYWLYLSSNKELTFFQQLTLLKIRVLLCGARYQISCQQSKFIKIISSKLDRSLQSVQQLNDSLSALSQVDLKRIEDTLTRHYYLK